MTNNKPEKVSQYDKINAPYNFVPLNREVLIPENWKQISQDIPFSDGEDGSISVTFKNLTPLLIKNGMDKEKEEDNLSAHVVDKEGRRLYFLPGTSIKGMIRSVLEVFSFSEMKQYDDDFFGYRVFDTRDTRNKRYKAAMDKVRIGWLRTTGEDQYELDDCGELSEKNTVSKRRVTDEIKHTSIEELERMYQTDKELDGMILICTGAINGKKKEYLFPKQGSGNTKIVNKSVIEEFRSVYKPSSPRFDDLFKRFDKGERIPVFFVDDGDKHHIGLSRYFRYPYKNRVSDGVKQEKIHVDGSVADKEAVDMSNGIFGCIARDKQGTSLKGRVQFGNAFADKLVDESKITKKGVLGQPKPSYHPLYIKQDMEDKYKTYDDDITIAGRKFYRIHFGDSTSELPQGNDNEKTKSVLNLLPTGISFSLKIRVHNMRPFEIGALLSAITFHNTKGCHHNIGMAKGFGFGKLSIEHCSIDGFNSSAEDYMKNFEIYMSRFTSSRKSNKCMWTDTEQVHQLLSIATDHDKDLSVMSLDDYAFFKRDNHFSKLKEIEVAPNSFVEVKNMKLDIVRSAHQQEYANIQKAIDTESFDVAADIIKNLEREIRPVEDPQIEEMKKKIDLKRREKEEREQKEKEALENEQKEKKMAAGLDFLNEKYDNKEEYKVNDFKGAQNRINAYLKKQKVTMIPDPEKPKLKTFMQRISKNPDKKDIKELPDFDKNIWKTISGWIGDAAAKQLFDELKN
ncbi:MAG: TIGR03986 family CRISPR-associated RAMP protein [Phocaeicola sp.]|nr:TIGR03986 family CRISPR-associated RAMP protein [Phocaeicola sp.]